MAQQAVIVEKALKCIDEIYPCDSSINNEYFPMDAFYEEAIRWAVDNAPAKYLGKGTSIPTSNAMRGGRFNDVVIVDVSSLDFGRLLRFSLEGWYTKEVVLYDTDARYAQMANATLRGKASHPMVFVCDNKTRIEAYSMPVEATSISIVKATYLPYDATYFTGDMVDIAAWKLAELILLSISDTNAATVCSAHINELIQ